MIPELYTAHLKEKYTPAEIAALSLDYLDVQPRVHKLIKAAWPGKTIGQVCDMTKAEATKTPNMGRAAVNALEWALNSLGLRFKAELGPIVNEAARALAYDVYLDA